MASSPQYKDRGHFCTMCVPSGIGKLLVDVDLLDPFLQQLLSDLTYSLAKDDPRVREGKPARRDAFPFTRKITSQMAVKFFDRALIRATGAVSGRSTKRWTAAQRDSVGE